MTKRYLDRIRVKFDKPFVCFQAISLLREDGKLCNLMQLILLFDTASASSKLGNLSESDRQMSGRIQEKFATLLHKYLAAKLGRNQASKVLPQLIYLMPELQSLVDLTEQKNH